MGKGMGTCMVLFRKKRVGILLFSYGIGKYRKMNGILYEELRIIRIEYTIFNRIILENLI